MKKNIIIVSSGLVENGAALFVMKFQRVLPLTATLAGNL
jgi:hypothetical protein